MSKVIDIKGQRFGLLTVLEYDGGPFWRCKCDCGRETLARGTSLRKGDKKSCGCRGKKKKTQEMCEYCGEPVLADGRRFCSPSCAGKARFGVKLVEVDENHKWEKAIGSLWKCRYQRNVSCADRDCANCGWNPEVAAARSAAIRRKLEEEYGKNDRE